MCDGKGLTDSNDNSSNDSSGRPADGITCRQIMKAYELSRYDLFKEKYEKNGSKHR